jgi:acyl-coenzyme A thioesterase PaaI-like protein
LVDPPRDLLAEIETELDAALVELRLSVDHVSALAELRGTVVAETIRRGRPIVVAELLDAAPDEDRRGRFLLLLRRLRGERRRY